MFTVQSRHVSHTLGVSKPRLRITGLDFKCKCNSIPRKNDVIKYPYAWMVCGPSQLVFIKWNGFSEICRLKERRLSGASANLIFAHLQICVG